MVGNPRESSDWPNIVREGIEPEPAWKRRDWTKPFPDIPLPGSRTPRLPSWFEDPSQPGLLPPSLQYPSPIWAPVPEPSTIPKGQIHQWLFDYLLGNNLPDQGQLQQTSQSGLKTNASRNVLDKDMRLAASQQADQDHPTRASQTGRNEEPSKPQNRFLISRVESR